MSVEKNSENLESLGDNSLESQYDPFHHSEETAVLEQIESLVDKQREKKEGFSFDGNSQGSNFSTATGDDSNDDNNGGASSPVKYYGYSIPPSLLENPSSLKLTDLSKSGSWLSVWIARVMEKMS